MPLTRRESLISSSPIRIPFLSFSCLIITLRFHTSWIWVGSEQPFLCLTLGFSQSAWCHLWGMVDWVGFISQTLALEPTQCSGTGEAAFLALDHVTGLGRVEGSLKISYLSLCFPIWVSSWAPVLSCVQEHTRSISAKPQVLTYSPGQGAREGGGDRAVESPVMQRTRSQRKWSLLFIRDIK